VYPVNSGANSASIWAVDAAGNESNRISFTFKVDTAPPVIRDLKATTVNPLGWQSSKSVKLSWTNFGEELENATQSGVASVTLDIGPATGSASSHDLKTIASPGINSYDGLILPGNGLWKIAAKTKDNAGSNSLSQLVQVGVDSTVLAAPVVKPLPKVGAAQLAAGVNLSWSKPINVGDSPSGICNYTMSVDHAPHSDPGSGGGIDASATGAKLPAFLESGANYLHLRAVNCAGVPGQIADVPFQVASVAPTIELSSPNQSGWFTTAHPLHATIVDPDDQGVELASTIDGIVGPDAAGPELDIPLDEGEHTVVVTGTDSVGNSSTRVTLARSDLAPPTVKFDAFDPAHPTRVGATVTDASSGVQDAQLQYRSATGGSWQMLGPFVRASGGSQAKLELSANFPDTELDPGIYDLSLVTYDAAGLRTDEGKRIDGSPATLRLPLRSQPSLTANFVSEVATKKCKRTTLKQKLCSTGKLLRKQVASQSTTVDYGQTATVSGSLHDASGEPVANAPLDVFEDAIGSGRRKVDTISTNDVGKFSYATDQGPSRAISVRFGGTDTQLPDQASVDFLVRSQLTLSLNPRHVHGGSTVTFTGHLNAAGAAFPRSGKEIKFQQFRDGKWKLFPLEAVAGPDGNFRADYATGKVKSPLLFKLRAKAPGADGWAYEAGFSSAVNLEVRR
jgi:hypothetical protein